MTPIVRAALPADADAIATAHVAAWREAYQGLLPDAVLAGLSVASRSEQWRQTLTRAPATHSVFIAEAQSADIVGFISGGPRRAQGLAGDAEVYALYVRAAAQRQGLGRQLMRALGVALRERGFHSLGLWVLRENAAARGFYARLGGERRDMEAGHTITETAYEWRDLAVLAEVVTPTGSGT
jgi:ribosomal protein S18 acetylase RimI-like enzyme